MRNKSGHGPLLLVKAISMKKLILLPLFLAFFGLNSKAQTLLIDEDFEGATLSVTSSSSSGVGGWALSSNLQVSGSNSDTAAVQQGDTLFLETQAFDASSIAFMTLEFEHICKIDFFDQAIVQISTDNGQSWTSLSSAEYTGSAFFASGAFSAVSYGIWNIGQPAAIPTNAWWQKETFNLANFVGNAQTKVRFALIDADNNGAVNNYGWLIDDLKVIGASCELIPPTISLTGTTYNGLVYTTGPYPVQADIADASGIDSASLTYTLNSGAAVTLPMSRVSGNNIFQATIPSAAIGDTICYSIYASDSTSCVNSTIFPSSTGCTQFEVRNNPPPNCVGTPVFNYDYTESFASFTSGGGTTVGTLQNNWVNEPTADSHDWYVNDQGTPSAGTGPTTGRTPTDQQYMYVESSGAFRNRTAILNTPCYDLSALVAPKFSFWYHMDGAQMGELHLDAYFGGQWVNDIIPAYIGAQGSNWNFREVDISAYAGSIVLFRFRAITGNGFQSDIAIDDVSIIEPLANDLNLTDIITPNVSGCNGSANDFVTLEITNDGSAVQDTIPLAYTLNGGAIVRDTAFVNLNPGISFNHTFQQTVNLAAQGSYSFDFWIELGNDQNRDNDSIFNYTVASSPVTTAFPDTTNFDNFTNGTPGTLVDGWTNGIFDSHDWWVQNGGTPSNNTGPAADHTSGSGNYMYIEASNFNNLDAVLLSKCFDIRNLNRAELSFFYHMDGLTQGELRLDILVNGILIQDIMPPIMGSQGPNWNLQTVDLSPYSGVVKLLFRGITGNGFQSDIALDDVVIRDANPVGIEESIANRSRLLLFPNPASESVWLELDEDQSASMILRNKLGQVVMQQELINAQTLLDLSDLRTGLYMVEVLHENGERSVQRLIKK